MKFFIITITAKAIERIDCNSLEEGRERFTDLLNTALVKDCCDPGKLPYWSITLCNQFEKGFKGKLHIGALMKFENNMAAS